MTRRRDMRAMYLGTLCMGTAGRPYEIALSCALLSILKHRYGSHGSGLGARPEGADFGDGSLVG